MRRLLACTCLTPLAIAALEGSVRAEMVVSTKVTTPLATATAGNGSADDIRITSSGSVAPTSGTAITVNSGNSVKNEGTIQITGTNDATGIFVNPGAAGTITNSGKIIIDETYTPADADKDGDNDGPFAQGSGRYGIRVAPGATLTGNIANSGTITIEGNSSAGIAVDGSLAGSLTSSGPISVVGNDSAGIRANNVTGSVQLTGSIIAQGGNAVGVDLNGNIGGALVIQGAIESTGYRSAVVPADPSKLDADDLLQGGPALRIAGDVAGGILLATRPADANPNDKDEDDDGIEDDKEGVAAITSRGGAPAVQIGASDRSVTVGPVAGNAAGHGLVVNGLITGNGVYSGVNANGLVIGGLGGTVTIAGGLSVNGAVNANSNGASATAIRIGQGASVNEIRVTGTVGASGGNGASAFSRAILIDSGATVTAIRNSGSINAATTGNGTAGAIVDNSGQVALIENAGIISATGAPAGSDRGTAIDLQANGAGAIVRQTMVSQGSPRITGNILFGAGGDLLDLADGSVEGTTRFGAGDDRLLMAGDATYTGAAQFGAGNDRLSLAGSTVFSGTVDFGGGADLLDLAGTARFTGTLANSAGLAVQLDGGTLDVANLGTVALSSLALTGQSTLGVRIDAAAGTSTLFEVGGTASFGAGSRLRVSLANVSESEGRHVVLRAGSLTGSSGLTFESASLPFLFKGSLDANEAADEVAVIIARKTVAELGLNGSESRAYDAIFSVLDADEDIADAFLGLSNAASVRSTLQQMLPEHAGGAFDTVTQGSRATARFLQDPRAPLADQGRWGFWLQQVAWGSSKDLGDTSDYDITGWGAAGGAELITGRVGSFGLSVAYLNGEDAGDSTDNNVRAEQYELAAYWRGAWGGFRAWARGSAALIDFNGQRNFAAVVDGQAVTRSARGSWDGRLYSAAAGLSYEAQFGRLSLRPTAAVDYYRLSEDGYGETGGGDAFNLIVDERDSDELAGTATLAVGFDLGRRESGSTWLRAELEGGRRHILAGELGATTARFEDGDPFTLLPETRSDGWVGRLRLAGGGDGFTIGGEASAEEQHDKAALAFRVTLSLGL